MKYKKGYTIKPLRKDNGVVIFTDGTNEIQPSQKSCLAYGYKWHAPSGTCVIARKMNNDVAKEISNGYNSILGRKNRLGGTIENSVIAGEGNKLEGNNKNIIINGNNNLVKAGVFNSSIVSGDQNVLGSGVNNSTVISGVGAISIRDAETVIGGFYTDGLTRSSVPQAFTCQSSQFMMQLSLDNTTSLTALNVPNGNPYFPVNPNSFIDFTAECMATGDNLQKFCSGILTGKISVGSNGIPALQTSTYTHKANSVSNPFLNHTFYLSTNGSSVVIRTQGIAGEIAIFTASVKLTEVIHDPSIIL